MAGLTGPVLAASFLLLVAGAVKVRRPVETAEALGARRLAGVAGAHAVAVAAVRLLGAAECTLGLAGLAVGGRAVAAAVAAGYAGFTLYVAMVLRRNGSGAACSCLGGATGRATRTHVAVTGGFAALAAVAAVTGADGVPVALSTSPMQAVPLLLVTAALAGCAWAALALLPQLSPATRGASPGHR